MAMASHPSDRSLRRSQPTATATPSSANAAVVTMERAWIRLLTKSSGGAEALDARDLACKDLHHLGIPLGACAGAKHGHGFFGRVAHSVRPIVDQSVEGVAHRDDSRQPRDLPSLKT